MEIPYRVPIIGIRDKYDGQIHTYGTDTHDSLMMDENGAITYYNLQNGDGTGHEQDYGYEFVDNSDECGYGAIKEVYLEHKNHSEKYEDMTREQLLFQCLLKDAKVREMEAKINELLQDGED